MEQDHRLLKIIIVGASVIAIVAVVGFIVSTKSTFAPTNEDVVVENATTTEDASANAAAASSSLNKVSPSSSLDSDFDAYLNSEGSVPNPNDFNDSYSDLNQ